MYGRLKRMARLESGAANVVALALILPLVLYLGYSGIMNSHLADVKGVMENAARAAARDYADGGMMAHARMLAYDVVSGSLPTGGSIKPTTPSGEGALAGVLSSTGGDYYITPSNTNGTSGAPVEVEPANNTVSGQLSSLAGQDVTAAGNYATLPPRIQATFAAPYPVPTQKVNETAGAEDIPGGNTRTVDQSAAGGVQATPNQTLTQTAGTGGPGSGSGGTQTVNQTVGSWQPGQTLTVSQVNGVEAQWGQGPWGTWWGDSHLSGADWLWSHRTQHPGYSISYGEQANFAGGFYNPQPWSQYTLYTSGDDTSTSWYSFSDSAGSHSGSVSSAGALVNGVPFNTQDSPGPWLAVNGTAQNDYGPAGYISALFWNGYEYTTSYTPWTEPRGFYNHYPGFSVPTAQWVTISSPNDPYQPDSIWVDSNRGADVANNWYQGGGANPVSFYAYPWLTYSIDIWGWANHYNLLETFSNPQAVFGTNGNWSVTDTTGVNYQPVILPTTMAPGSTVTVPVTVTNSDQPSFGNFTWPDDKAANWANVPSWYDPVHVSYHWFQNGQTIVSEGTGAGLPYNVGPGQSATIYLSITAPSTPGTYQLEIDTVEDAVQWWSWMNSNVLKATINVQTTLPWSAGFSNITFPTNVVPNSINNIPVTVQNTGSQTWTPNYTWLAVHSQGNLGDGTDIVTVGQNVAPGQSYTFTLPFKAPDWSMPNFQGVWNFTIDMAQTRGGWWNNGFWFSSQGSGYVNGHVMVRGADGWSSAPVTTPVNMAPGTKTAVAVTLKNTGTSTWDSNVWLADGWFENGGFMENDNSTNAVTVQGTVPPGQSHTFDYTVTAPSTPGTYQLCFNLNDNVTGTVAGNLYGAWFVIPVSENTQNTINVTDIYGVHYSPVTAPAVMSAGSNTTVQVTVENTSDFTWPAGGNNPVQMSYHWLQNGQSVQTGTPANLSNDIAPGQSMTVALPVVAPIQPGSYTLQIDMVRGSTWFGTQGAPVVNIPMVVPAGQELIGQLTRDNMGNYWIQNTEVLPQNGVNLEPYLNRFVALWGTVLPADHYFLADGVEPAQNYNNNLSAGTQYDPDLDCAVYTETVNGVRYAAAQVRYHYPVPVPTLPMLLNPSASPLNNSETVYGTAEFPVGA